MLSMLARDCLACKVLMRTPMHAFSVPEIVWVENRQEIRTFKSATTVPLREGAVECVSSKINLFRVFF